MFGFLKKLLGGEAAREPAAKPGTFGVGELSRRLGIREAELLSTPVTYHRFVIAKRTGGQRTILAPDPKLKAIQRRILHRLLRRLKAHPCATGFERGHSIVTNAIAHSGKEVVLKLDLENFFGSIKSHRVEDYFRTIGWNADAAALLTRLCTHDGSLPQGAPTSPRLSNLVNYQLDARLAAVAVSRGISYSRYADDITFSGPAQSPRMNDMINVVDMIVVQYRYRLHTEKKLRIARRHDRQVVTGLVVNEKVQLPRATRRRLRAIEHRLRTTGTATMSQQQLAGWRALQHMIVTQSSV